MKNIVSLTIAFFLVSSIVAQDQNLVPFGSTWKYLDDGSNQGTSWRSLSFNDGGWSSGPAKLGYGEGDENTVVSYGSSSSNKHITTYFRHTVNIPDVTLYKNFLFKLIKDDGALVYVNGQNVMRSNFGTNSYDYDDEAYSSISGSEETIIWEEFVPPSFFQNGNNVIAVEVHQYDAGSSDLSFDLEVIGLDDDPSLYREPYIQLTTPTTAIIKWKTDAPTDSKVEYGPSPSNFVFTESTPTPTMNHEVELTGLTPDTKYYYSVGNSMVDFTTPSGTHFFKTHPNIGVMKPTRIWVTGDAGTGKTGQLDVRDAYLNYIGQWEKADIWLMMGDNAYEHGREADYHMGLFNVYQTILRNTVSYPTSGNHDFYGEASPITQTGTYFDIFALPKNAEAGGTPSGTEAYYSFDYGNIHFVCMESYALNRDSTGTMANWLKNDLQNTNAKWLIAYWHYAPYTKVGHDSDDPNDHSGRAIEMRENINPILEQYGVDLVLAGHSHGYERSFLMDGHYGFSNSLTPAMILDNTSGRADVTGAYIKPNNLTPHNGTVYAVCGSSGKLSSTSVFHPAMYDTNVDYLGSMVIDIAGDTLESKFLNENGIVQDYFHIVKTSLASDEQESTDGSEFKIYPNPSQDQFTIDYELNSSYKKGSIQVYSTNGQIVKVIELKNKLKGSGQSTIDVSDLSKGVYTVKLIGDYTHLKSELLIIR